MEDDERRRLLSQKGGDAPQYTGSNIGYGPGNSNGGQAQAEGGLVPRTNSSTGEGDTPAAVPPIGPDELPPPYQQSAQTGAPMITCRVCQQMIDVGDKKDQHVVKCTRCLEATPIRNAPPGKKYVRCPCNCLLICKSTSQRIACPRPDCKRIINLAPSPVSPPPALTAGMVTTTCVRCHDTFLYKRESSGLVVCPHCRGVSHVGGNSTIIRIFVYGVIGLIFLSVGIGVTLGTYRSAAAHGGIYVVYIGAFVLALLAFWRSIYYIYILRRSRINQI